MRDLGLSKSKTQLLASKFHQWNLQDEDVKMSVYRNQQKHFTSYFKTEKKSFVACCDVNGFMTSSMMGHIPQNWRLFIDLFKLSLKAVLLHIGNSPLSVPLCHFVHLNEINENIKLLLEQIKYEDVSGWQMYGDLMLKT